MKRRDFLKQSAGTVLGALAAGAAAQAAHAADPAVRPPNIVLIFADDLGWGELGVYGGKDVPTPNIDGIATGGVRFTQGYVSCPVCSPTRAGLMTGRYQQRFGHEFNPGNAQQAPANFGLPLDQVTIGDRLRTLGYATGWIGKSHLGYQPAYNPTKRGFDEFYGFLGGARSYLPNKSDDRPTPLYRGTEKVSDDFDYTTFGFAREAVSFVERHKAAPFFLYLPFNAVHGPMEAPESHLARFAHIADEKRRTFAAMLSALDDAVGQVLGALDANGVRENTLILFISDNGGPTPTTTSGNGPLRATKATVYEGGIRVPFLLQWPGHVPAGTVYDAPVIALDVLPTVVCAAGGKVAPEWNLDGVDILPFVTGKSTGVPHEDLFWRFGAQRAVRHGDWKLLVPPVGKKEAVGLPELYNLAKDIGEKEDRFTAEPEVAARLQAIYDAWNTKNIAPLWGSKGTPAAQRNKKAATPTGN